MSYLAPQWAFGAQAIDSAGDSHLAKGVHLRLFLSQVLGLPIFPFDVYRVNIGSASSLQQVRTDGITWIDSKGNTLSYPFTVTPDNPVTGWLPAPPSVCCWIDVGAVPSTGTTGITPLPITVLPGRIAVPSIAPRPNIGPGIIDVGPIRPNPVAATVSNLRVDAVVGTMRGPGILASRTAAPYTLSASRIDRVIVSGSGTVRNARWLDADRLRGYMERAWRRLALPYEKGLRYAGLPNAEAFAKARVFRGAPLREAMMDAPNAANPVASPAIAVPDATEWGRVDSRRPPVMKHVDRLINDLSALPKELTELTTVQDEHGKDIGTFTTNVLGSVLSSALDAGMARLLGLSEVDETAAGLGAGNVVLYLVRGIWDLSQLRLDKIFDTLFPADARVPASKLPQPPPEASKGDFLDLYAVACATIGIPPDGPASPVLAVPELGPWLPVPPPDVQREIRLPASGLSPGALIALARQGTAGFISLNEKAPDGRRFPLTPSVPNEASDASNGTFFDREAPAPATTYRLAQSDWFGRWSNWAARTAAAGVRPAPPRPAPQLFYQAPVIPEPVPNGPLPGTVLIQVTVPKPVDMAPGSFPLASLEVTLNGVVTNHAITVIAGQDQPVTLSGPPLPRCGTGTLSLVTRWIDTQGTPSQPSPKIDRAIADPRPPVQVVIPNLLNYGSRPDVTGKSRVDLRWSADPTQKRFRVFYSDETTLRTRLERMVSRNEPGKVRAQSILNAIDAATNAPDRAAAYIANKDFLTRDMFELLTADPLSSPGFVHLLSGSLRVVCFYRIVAVSDSNVEVDYVGSPMVPYAVPNSGAPATPSLQVRPHPTLANTAQIHIKVPAGAVVATEYRLRRSVSTAKDALRMPVASTGMVPAVSLTPPVGEPNTTAQTVDVDDTGTSELQPAGTLQSWTNYSWRVEVRGANEPGGGPSGEWSLPSPAVTAALIPPDPPAPVADVNLVGLGGGAVQISCTHPEKLLGGSMGAYSIDLYQQPPGGPEKIVTSLSADAYPADGGRNADRTGTFRFTVPGPVASQTVFRIIVIDPVGRISAPSSPVVAP